MSGRIYQGAANISTPPASSPQCADAETFDKIHLHFLTPLDVNEPERREDDARLVWDDIVIGYRQRSDEYLVEEPEMIEFATHFDPMPIHINPMAAAKSQFGTVTASGSYMLALRQKLAHQFAFSKTVIASIGLDEVRFVAPLHAGQRCQLEIVFLDKRPSRKRADRGVVTIGMALIAEHQPVLTLKDIVLVWIKACAPIRPAI